jgi:pimeloyl-ACP methyl ester carboxylesterase
MARTNAVANSQRPNTRKIQRGIAIVSGAAGTLLGVATNLYSGEFRGALESWGREFNSTVLSLGLATVVSSASTAVIYRWLSRRRNNVSVTARTIDINADVLKSAIDMQDNVAGRSLHYLEAKRQSEHIVVFLHGLGLDANDFRAYMVESKFHCVSLTLYGFNAKEREDEGYQPISLASHVQLLAYALRNLRRQYPRKRLTLVGFSFGADMILFLTRYAQDAAHKLEINKILLLDPNVNRSTTTISSKIAKVDESKPLTQLTWILNAASNDPEFRYLCEYLYKITSKNFNQIQRHAREVARMWDTESYDRFLDFLGQVNSIATAVHVVLSFNHERLFNPIVQGVSARGLDADHLGCSRSDHFELIEADFLKERLEGIL